MLICRAGDWPARTWSLQSCRVVLQLHKRNHSCRSLSGHNSVWLKPFTYRTRENRTWRGQKNPWTAREHVGPFFFSSMTREHTSRCTTCTNVAAESRSRVPDRDRKAHLVLRTHRRLATYASTPPRDAVHGGTAHGANFFFFLRFEKTPHAASLSSPRLPRPIAAATRRGPSCRYHHVALAGPISGQPGPPTTMRIESNGCPCARAASFPPARPRVSSTPIEPASSSSDRPRTGRTRPNRTGSM